MAVNHNCILTDPSGTYISYDAIAIGSGSDQVTDFLEKTYKNDLSLDDASALAAAGIYLSSEDKEGTGHIRMAHIKTDTGLYEIVSEEQIANYAKTAKKNIHIAKLIILTVCEIITLKLSVAIPESSLSDESLKIDKTRKISVLARACAIFKIDTIYVYQEGNNKQDGNLLVMILKYLETPQFLRKDYFQK